jgi:Zn-dependent protease with chaperone function
MRLFMRSLVGRCTGILLVSLLAWLAPQAVHAQSAESGAKPFSLPPAVSELYSRIDLYVKLAFTPAQVRNAYDPVVPECSGPTPFEQRVVRLGERLAQVAYQLYPDLKARIPHFEFTVSDRLEPGIASTARGLIVVLTPVNDIVVSDETLAFVIAREMGHVISRHHEQNTVTSIAFSLAAAILAPALNLGRLLASASAAASNSTLANAVSSGASYASSRVMIESYGPRQRRTADAVALRLLPGSGFDTRAVAQGITPVCGATEPTRWQRQFAESIAAIPAAPIQPAPAAVTAAVPANAPAP